ncbi:MAG: hypothetical protein A2W17_01660 [Planctomycetes bacterium RBG_16_41_13]|nr:MAG: hypothetical protein A2W17_01660 [Planctomycetes bacterium RBG_16_41_13]
MEDNKEPNVAVLMVHGIGEHNPGDMLKGVVNGFQKLFDKIRSLKPEGRLIKIDTDIQKLDNDKKLETFTLPANEENHSREREYKKYSFSVDISAEQIRKKIYFTCLDVNWAHLFDPPTTMEFLRWLRLTALGTLKNVNISFPFSMVGHIFRAMQLIPIWFVSIIPSLVFEKLCPSLFKKIFIFVGGDIQVYGVNDTKARRIIDHLKDLLRYEVLKNKVTENEKSNVSNEFTDVIIISHSLGTVISYECIAELYKESCSHNQNKEFDINKLTTLFTVGSPLDKFRYLWGTKKPNRFGPHVLVHKDLKWYNIFSYLDFVSAEIDLFSPGPDQFEVNNTIFPFIGHTMYWDNLKSMSYTFSRILDSLRTGKTDNEKLVNGYEQFIQKRKFSLELGRFSQIMVRAGRWSLEFVPVGGAGYGIYCLLKYFGVIVS